jgi:hypothetical protein
MFNVDTDNILLKRFTIAKKLQYYIEESIYYRTHSDSININARKVLWRIEDAEGKTQIK